MSLQARTDALVQIVRGFNVELANQLQRAIGEERTTAYYALQAERTKNRDPDLSESDDA